MKIRAILVALLVLTGGLARAEDKPSTDLPVYPGGEATMEVNLSNQDILPTLKAMIPMLGAKYSKVFEKISPEDIASVLKDVRRIEFLQLDVAKPNTNESDIVAFYSKNLPSGTWARLFWQSTRAAGTTAVYSQDGAEMFYGFRVRSVPDNGKTIKRVEIIKIEGKIDFAKLLTLAGKYLEASAK